MAKELGTFPLLKSPANGKIVPDGKIAFARPKEPKRLRIGTALIDSTNGILFVDSASPEKITFTKNLLKDFSAKVPGRSPSGISSPPSPSVSLTAFTLYVVKIRLFTLEVFGT